MLFFGGAVWGWAFLAGLLIASIGLVVLLVSDYDQDAFLGLVIAGCGILVFLSSFFADTPVETSINCKA